MKRRLMVLTSIMMIAIMLGGCGSKVEEKVELTDRQIDILMSEDLPTDWDKLTVRQKESIKAIEEMLQYLEDKYDKTFIYKGYRADDPLFHDEESLLVYAEGDNPDTDCFTVERTEDGFEDDYEVVLAQDGYHEKIENSISSYLEGKTYKLLSEVGKIDEKKGFPRGSVYIFIEADEIDSISETTKELEDTLFNIEGVDNLTIYYLNNIVIESLTINNWEDKIEKENIVDREFSVEREWRKR